ncbi:MAG: RluA family pseudouridine synthase [Clostridiales bacterium]|nr:RluA family pseudouridine synthase [Clostridiales bacterium]
MVRILFQDKDIVICEKQPGMISQESEDKNSLPRLLRELTNSDIFVLHRLDTPTGGAIMYAKNKKAAAAFSQMTAENKIIKEYLTVLDGCPKDNNGELRDLLFRDKSRNKSYVVKRMRKGVKEARLLYDVTDKSESNSLVKIRLITGRTHQIRVQFSSRGTPVTGDGKYGSRNNKCETALWCALLEFTHPITGEKIRVHSMPDCKEYPWSLFNSDYFLKT